ncbi:D-alanyl-D-alanine carboxypeptidase family protein [Phormidium tenue FACHB-886]|nr:D-alanyl-D-alanine carboxypeptidase family protein [Phormidium tenue FACHB-886]
MQEDAAVEDTNLPEISDPPKELPLKDLPSAARDIPMAVREMPIVQSAKRVKRQLWLWRLGGTSAAALLAVGASLALRSPSTPLPAPAASVSPSPVAAAQPSPTASPDLLGHLPYAEAPREELEPITPDASILMRKPAAEKFMEMQAAARVQGIELVPLSGFRSMEDQSHVFFDVKAERGQTPVTRAEVSAPPGYSEHHTGYAIDVGDGERLDLNLQTEFESTRAYQWLKDNAVSFNFELSFPKDNKRVSYEPWHWRFVGDRQSLETFYRAEPAGQPQNQAGQPQNQTGQQN